MTEDEYDSLDESIATSLPGHPATNYGFDDLFKPTSNVKFQPLPSTSGKCSKLKINITLNSTLFVAGESIAGRVEVSSSTDSYLYLGEIAVDINGYEGKFYVFFNILLEIFGKKFHQSASFLKARRVYQGDKLPPSDAVQGAPTKDGYYLAKKGKTVRLIVIDSGSSIFHSPSNYQLMVHRHLNFNLQHI